MGKPEPIQSILPSILEKLQGTSHHEVEVLWKRFLGRKAAKTQIESYRGKTLAVSVENASLLYELSLETEELIRKFEKALGSNKVQGIRLRIGGVRSPCQESKRAPKKD